MPSINSNIEIGDNSIHFNNESLKISNIARTWIFRYQNIEKNQFEKTKIEYENTKIRYENAKKARKKEKIRSCIIVAIVLGLLGIVLLGMLDFESTILLGTVSIILLCSVGICIMFAYMVKNENISYPYAAPQERTFPEKYGLGIGMNSGYSVVFTAIGIEGVKALSQLQRDIDDADNRNEITIFNMNDHHITVENNEGIISTGDNSDNIIEERELLKV